VANRAVELQAEALRIQRRKFENGRATSRDVLTSTSVLTQAKVEAVRALYDYNVALMKLHRVRGGNPREAPKTKP
jgi:outer membrane protein TolC